MNYLDVLANQIRSRVPPGDLPHGETQSLFRLYAVLLLAKGEAVDRRDVHNAWSAWMSDRTQEHEALIPYDDLPDATTAEDQPFVAAIRSVARSLREVGEQ